MSFTFFTVSTRILTFFYHENALSQVMKEIAILGETQQLLGRASFDSLFPVYAATGKGHPEEVTHVSLREPAGDVRTAKFDRIYIYSFAWNDPHRTPVGGYN
jgi:hypothetical protein